MAVPVVIIEHLVKSDGTRTMNKHLLSIELRMEIVKATLSGMQSEDAKRSFFGDKPRFVEYHYNIEIEKLINLEKELMDLPDE
jgi:hypothetical protein